MSEPSDVAVYEFARLLAAADFLLHPPPEHARQAAWTTGARAK